ncbi:LytTR family DNA-binding domain-containing protein [Conexibacter sp. DBS9H8]|uniref:LytR/AlgR family response regulator transcription factor n=1 Tax=Conexibacter sp. DBS9H8 TaxID=2937801 RepID=UPI00200F4A5D|nr:LytTR family DNA-binding domain-containing protein [Conexibacter sp. DBS9H8]
MRVLAVDDEPRALEDLGRVLAGCACVEAVVLAAGGAEALRRLASERFDAVFFDVRMPGLDGLELGGILDRFVDPPALIFVSAFEDGAVGAFENGLRPVDYLMKPVSRARVQRALARVGEARERGASDAAVPRPGGEDEIIPIENQHGGATRLVARSSVLFLKAEGDYVRIHTDAGRFLVRASLAELEARWEPYGFVRVHRSYLANLRRATEIRPELGGGAAVIFADGFEVPVARRHVAELRRLLRG